jgi:DNA replicative helicase MCM subunit Mcm2 (Cdc46/Mcm family)
MYLSDTVDVKHADSAIDLMNLFLNVTLGGDVDYALFGVDSEQRRKDTDPATLLVGIINDGGPNGMDEQEVYDRMENEGGYSKHNVEKYLEKLRNEGRLLKDGYDKWRPG